MERNDSKVKASSTSKASTVNNNEDKMYYIYRYADLANEYDFCVFDHVIDEDDEDNEDFWGDASDYDFVTSFIPGNPAVTFVRHTMVAELDPKLVFKEGEWNEGMGFEDLERLVDKYGLESLWDMNVDERNDEQVDEPFYADPEDNHYYMDEDDEDDLVIELHDYKDGMFYILREFIYEVVFTVDEKELGVNPDPYVSREFSVYRS